MDVRFGADLFITDYSIDVRDLAREVEVRGFESLLVTEHTHIPVKRTRESPSGGIELADRYLHSLDPFVVLGAAAAVTERIKLGTGVCLVAQRDPIVLAKEVASLDWLSGGRFLFGVSGGWNKEEIENHGAPFPRRWRILRERVLAMKEIWAQDEAQFHGEHVNFDPLWSWPKPVTRPHPPILVGGDAEGTLARVVEYGDEWMPVAGASEEHYRRRFEELQELAERAGRGRIPLTIFGARGSREDVEAYLRAGATRILFALRSESALPTIAYLDKLRALVDDLMDEPASARS